MGKNSKIEWTDHSWNPWRGCRKVSAGCKNCYMFRQQHRWGNNPDIVVRASTITFNAPLKWREPAKVFTCSWSDFFIEDADPWRDDAWDIIRQTPGQTYQVLTKRPENIKDRLPEDWGIGWENVWLGVTVENQETADKRIPVLLGTPALMRFLSMEPLLGPVDLGFPLVSDAAYLTDTMVNWVIVGGESGPGARPMKPEWVRAIRDQCKEVGIPFFFKQWGGNRREPGGSWGGRELDGCIWDEMPNNIDLARKIHGE